MKLCQHVKYSPRQLLEKLMRAKLEQFEPKLFSVRCSRSCKSCLRQMRKCIREIAVQRTDFEV